LLIGRIGPERPRWPFNRIDYAERRTTAATEGGTRECRGGAILRFLSARAWKMPRLPRM
jgi:hypothetical protein